MSLLKADNLHKTYRLGKTEVNVLRGASLDVQEGEWLAILGASGSGKSTLLHLLGALDNPDRNDGSIQFNGQEITKFSESSRNAYRNRYVGFVFQFYHLLPELNVIENTALASMVKFGFWGFWNRQAKLYAQAQEILESFGLGHRLHHRPNELSGGERQRVAIARSLMNEPELLLADEPTGNLDAKTGGQILDVIEEMHAGRRQTMIMVTHDPAIAARADRIVHLEGGCVITSNQ